MFYYLQNVWQWFLVDFLIKGFDSVGKIDEKKYFHSLLTMQKINGDYFSKRRCGYRDLCNKDMRYYTQGV
jgi:hypothetical protein